MRTSWYTPRMAIGQSDLTDADLSGGPTGIPVSVMPPIVAAPPAAPANAPPSVLNKDTLLTLGGIAVVAVGVWLIMGE